MNTLLYHFRCELAGNYWRIVFGEIYLCVILSIIAIILDLFIDEIINQTTDYKL